MPSSRAFAVLFASASLALGTAQARGQAATESLNDAVASVNSGDRERVMAGREALFKLLNAYRTNPPALASFARDVGTALMPVATGNDPHAKLNVALVVQRTADQSGSVALADITTKLIADPSAAVSAYGLRAASNIVPRLLVDEKLAGSNAIVPAVVAAVKAHPESEAVASESYGALVRLLNDRTAGETLTPAGVTAATPRAVDAVHSLLAARLAQFGSGTLTEPNAEQPAISFLGRQNTWNLSFPPQRTQTVRLLLQLMQASASEMGQIPNTPATRLKLEALRNLVKSTAGSLIVICDPKVANKPALLPAVQKAASLGLATPVAEYKQVIGQIVTEFAKEMPETAAASQPAPAGQ